MKLNLMKRAIASCIRANSKLNGFPDLVFCERVLLVKLEYIYGLNY